jgi:putative PIN family toxin of toxin-antitoxin system
MIICIDTNVLVQLFGRHEAGRPLRMALLNGDIDLALSNEILLEYEEMVTRLSGSARWKQIENFLTLIYQLNSNVRFIEPHFRFQIVINDPDDNKFADCAISAEADHIVTGDRDFDVLIGSGYKPQPITIEAFVKRYL